MLARANADSAMASALNALMSSSGGAYAEGLMRFAVATTATDALASFKIEVRASTSDSWEASAGLYLDVIAGDSGATGRVRLRGDQIYFEGTDGTILNALLLTQQSEPLDTAITTEGSDSVIRPNLTNRQQRHKVTLNQDAEMRAPNGVTSMDYTVAVEWDGAGHALTHSDDFLNPKPSGFSTLDGVINIFRYSVQNTNPLEIAASLVSSFTRTPLLSFRDEINTGGSGTGIAGSGHPFDISSLDFVPGNLLIVLAHGVLENLNGAYGTWVYVDDGSPTDWTKVDSAGDGNKSNNGSSKRIIAWWKIADGSETSIDPLLWQSNTTNGGGWAYQAFSFDMLGGTLTKIGSTANVSGSTLQTISAGSHDAPVLELSWAARGSSGGVTTPDQSFSLTADGNYPADANSQVKGRTKFRLFQDPDTPSDGTTQDASSSLLSAGFCLA